MWDEPCCEPRHSKDAEFLVCRHGKSPFLNSHLLKQQAAMLSARDRQCPENRQPDPSKRDYKGA